MDETLEREAYNIRVQPLQHMQHPDLHLKHPDTTLATYKRKQMKHLRH